MAQGLDKHERAVEHQRDRPGENELRGAEGWPGVAVVKFGNTSVSVVNAARTASAALAPWSLESCSWWRTPPASRAQPTRPLQMIMTAANTVSRASRLVPPRRRA